MTFPINPIAVWELNGNVNDSTANALHGTQVGGGGYTTGLLGGANGALVLDNADDHFTLPDSPLFNIAAGEDFTWSWWYYPVALPASGRDYLMTEVANNGDPDAFVNADGTFQVQFEGTNTLTTGTVTLNAWNLLVGERVGTFVRAFINDVQSGNVSTVGGLAIGRTGSHRIYAGYAGSEVAQGRGDQVGFWKRALSGAEKTALYNGGAGVEFAAADTTAPVWTATYPKAGTITPTSIQALLQVDEAGTGYVVVVPNGDIPSVAQIKAGQRSNGSAAIASATGALVANVELQLALTGLSPHTEYDLWAVATDTAGNNTAATAFSQSDDQTINSLLAGVSIVSSVVLTNDTGTTAAKENIPFNLDVTFSDADGHADITDIAVQAITTPLGGVAPAIVAGAFSNNGALEKSRVFVVTPDITSAIIGYQIAFRATDGAATTLDQSTPLFAVGNTTPVATPTGPISLVESTANPAFKTLAGTDANAHTLLKKIERVEHPVGTIVATPAWLTIVEATGVMDASTPASDGIPYRVFYKVRDGA